jgi:coenzyme F420 hydrogenase subunit beta
MLEIEMLKSGLLPCQELEESVWMRNACSGCRACISVCPADALAYDHRLNKPYPVTPCVDCKACLDACPRMPANFDKTFSTDIIGPHIEIKSVRSKARSFSFQNGGAVTALLAAALEEGLVDCALVMDMDRWEQKAFPRAIYEAKDLEKCAGSKYTSNASLEPIRYMARDAKNVALVGTPCTIQAIGLLRNSSNEFGARLAGKIRFLIGLFCFEAFDDSLIAEVTNRLGTHPWRIRKMSAGEGKMSVALRDGSIREISLKDLEGLARPGCRSCADFTARLSDISIGSVGSAPGTSTMIARTLEGMGLFEIAEEMGYIEVQDCADVKAIENVGRQKLKRNGF